MEWNDGKKFADAVRELCKAKDVKIGYVEHKVGLSQGYLSRVSNNLKRLSLDNAVKIAKLLDSDVNDILSRKEMDKTQFMAFIKYKESELAILKYEYFIAYGDDTRK